MDAPRSEPPADSAAEAGDAPGPGPAVPPSPSASGSAVSRRFVLAGGAAAVGLLVAGCSGDGGSSGTSTSTSTAAGGTSTSGGATSAGGTETTTTVAGTSTGTAGGGAATVLRPADFEALGVCRALPEQMAGPYPSPELIERRDLREDRDGVALRVGAQVVDDACAPVAGAVVEIWHCDVDGDYSAYLDGETDDDAGNDGKRALIRVGIPA